MKITDNTINTNLINLIKNDKKEKKTDNDSSKKSDNEAHSLEISRMNIESSKNELKNVEEASKLVQNIKEDGLNSNNAVDIQGNNLDWRRVADLLLDE